MQTEFKRIRLSMGLNQQELADLLGTTQATVSRWETEKPPANTRTMIALRALQVAKLGGDADAAKAA